MLNRVIIMGRLTADPELRQTTSGISTCRFSVAVNRDYKSKETGERQADFIRVTAWRQQAEFVSRYFSKGKMIIVEGSLRNNDYTDANGVRHYSMDVQADSVHFGESRSSADASAGIGSIGNFNQPAQQQSAVQVADQSQSQQISQSQEAADTVQIGDLGDFEEILSDGEVPF